MTTIACRLACVGVLVVTGCSQEKGITTYTVPRPADIGMSRPDDAPATPQRMLGAIVPRTEQVWYFKLTGDADAVLKHVEDFGKFMQSVRFEDAGFPQWDLPDGWQQQAGSGMRFATLTLPGDGAPLELTVIPLGSDDPGSAKELLDNVNRWRGQMALPPMAESDLDNSPAEIQQINVNDQVMTLVNFVGTGSGGMSGMTPPFAGRPAGATGAMPAPDSPTTASSTTESPSGTMSNAVQYDVPEGWEPGRSGGLRKAAFNIRSADVAAEVTVIDLDRAVSPLLPNFNRWRSQVGLPEWSDAEFESAVETIPVGDLNGSYAVLHGTGPEKQDQSILGVIVYVGERAWFIKMTGDTKIVKQQDAKFRQFAASLKFADDQ